MESKDRQSTCMFLSIDPEFNGPNMFCMFSEALSPLQFYVSHLGIGDKKIRYKIKIIFLSDGESSRNINIEKKNILIKRRKEQAIKVSKLCKFQEPVFAEFPDNRLDTVAMLKVVKFIENEIKKFNRIFTNYN